MGEPSREGGLKLSCSLGKRLTIFYPESSPPNPVSFFWVSSLVSLVFLGESLAFSCRLSRSPSQFPFLFEPEFPSQTAFAAIMRCLHLIRMWPPFDFLDPACQTVSLAPGAFGAYSVRAGGMRFRRWEQENSANPGAEGSKRSGATRRTDGCPNFGPTSAAIHLLGCVSSWARKTPTVYLYLVLKCMRRTNRHKTFDTTMLYRQTSNRIGEGGL